MLFLVLALALTLPQTTRGTVQLEAADCSRINMMWGDYEVAYGVQHTTVPLSVGALDVQPGGNGGVRIEKGTGSAYSITACIGAGAATREEAQRAVDAVKLTIDGNRVRVDNSGTARSWSVQLVIEAPRGAQVNAETNNGPITITGVDGRFKVRASNGPIALDDVMGTVSATAQNGPISVSGSRGDFDVETQNGPISVDLRGTRWDGTLNARASNGPLSVHVSDNYTSGVEISSSGSSPWTCRVSACGTTGEDDRGWGRGRTLRLGRDPVVVRVSTHNGPVSIVRAR
jgi:hypothetical protein